MIFTDDDLKQLEAKAEGDQVALSHFQVQALLTRLKAAENYCLYTMPNDRKSSEFHKTWRKAVGK